VGLEDASSLRPSVLRSGFDLGRDEQRHGAKSAKGVIMFMSDLVTFNSDISCPCGRPSYEE
jgi:hypothetical protein